MEEAIRKSLRIGENEDDYLLKQVESDHIMFPFQSLMLGLTYMYKQDDEVIKGRVNNFIEKYESCSNLSMDEILSFKMNYKIVGDTYQRIPDQNGQLLLVHMLEEFSRLSELNY